MTGKYRDLAVNVALFVVNAFATKLVTFLLVPLYTAHLSTGEYGLTDMSLTVINLLTPLMTLSVADAALRYAVEDRGGANRYASVAFLVTALSVVLVAVVSPLLDLGAFGGLGGYKGWFVVAYATSALFSLCGEVARGFGRIRLIPVCAGVSSFVTLVSAVTLIGHAGMGVIGYFASVSVGPLVGILMYLTFGGMGGAFLDGLRALSRGGAGLARKTLSAMLRFSLPLVPNALLWWAQTSMSRLFVSGALGIDAAGMYAAASKVPGFLNTGYSVFQQAWQLSSFQEAREEALHRFYEVVFCFVQAGTTVACAVLSLLSPQVAALLLRGETYESWPMISILLVGSLMSVFNSFFGTVYTSTMHTNAIVRTTVIGAALCAVLTPALLPLMGVVGACVATAASQAVVFAMRALDSRRYVIFDAGWLRLVATLAALVLQAAVTSSQMHAWWPVSAACTAVVVCLQGARVATLLRSRRRAAL